MLSGLSLIGGVLGPLNLFFGEEAVVCVSRAPSVAFDLREREANVSEEPFEEDLNIK